MKYLVKFNESYVEEMRNDIIENFSYIIDTLGEPKITNQNWGDKHKWTVTFNLGIDISVMNEVNSTINMLKKISEDIEYVISASERLSEYNFQMSIKDKLIIEILPKIEKSESYNFITGQSWREIVVSKKEIEKYFASNGILLVKTWMDDDNYIEVSETCAVYFKFNKFDNEAFTEFLNKFNNEVNSHLENDIIDRNIVAEIYNHDDNSIQIFPTDEKTYVTTG